jgi:hypothetical protein
MFEIFMGRNSQDFGKIRIAARSATIFRRANMGSIQHVRVLDSRLGEHDLFQIA